jgi:helicase, putative
MGTVRQQIENCSSNICKNIEIYGTEILSNKEESSQHKLRGSLAQSILAQLRNLVEAVAAGHALDGNLEAKFAFKDEKGSVSKYVRKCKGSRKSKFIADFHDLLQKSTSHYTLSESDAERLMLKYYEYLLKIRAFCADEWGIYILENLKRYPLNLDRGLQKYYEIIAKEIDRKDLSPLPDRRDRYYIDRILPFFVNGKIYYEVTFHNAIDTSSKFNRIIGFTDIDMTDYYAANLKIKKTGVKVFGKDISINIIAGWEVSIRPCEFDNFFKLFDQGFQTMSTTRSEYKQLMGILTNNQMSLVDLIDLDEDEFGEYIDQVNSNAVNEEITSLLKLIREASNSGQNGMNVIRYLMLRMNNQIIKNQFAYTENELLSNTWLSYKCIPFDEMPFCTSLVGHNPQISDLLRCISIEGREHEFLNRLVKNNIEQGRNLYTPIAELNQWLVTYKSDFSGTNLGEAGIEKLIVRFNKKLYRGHESRSMYMLHKKYVYIREYVETIKEIIKKLCSYTHVEQHDLEFLDKADSLMRKVDDDGKKEALVKLFRDSKVAFVYGPAGTGKTTMINLVSTLFEGKKKIFLAHTNPAVENLKHRIDNPQDSTFLTISKYIQSRDVDTHCELLVIDECSTVSNRDFWSILKKIKANRILLVGDLYQIESIQFGNWFDIIRSFVPKTTIIELNQSFRTKSKKMIELWKRVRNNEDSIEELLTKEGYSKRLDASFFNSGNNPDEIILCLNYNGLYGINNVNQMLQDWNQNQPYEWNSAIYKKGDPVIFSDSYRFKPVVYNNLRGTIVKITLHKKEAWFDIDIKRKPNELQRTCLQLSDGDAEYLHGSVVRFKISRYVSPDSDERDVDYSVPFQVAYAISIHKAQGLEYDSVKVLVTSDIEDRISHNIFYTAITRAKRHLVIYWSPESERKILESFKHKTDHRTISLLCAHYPELKELRKDGI